MNLIPKITLAAVMSLFLMPIAQAVNEDGTRQTVLTDTYRYCYTLGSFTTKTYLNYLMGMDKSEAIRSINQTQDNPAVKDMLISLTHKIYTMRKAKSLKTVGVQTVGLSMKMEAECLRSVTSNEPIKISALYK